MGPTRTRDSGLTSASTSRLDDQESSKQKRAGKAHQHRRKHSEAADAPGGLPGVQKIKSALRQTRRLLAKDNLAADVRTKTERRLKALEADLAKAEQAKKERSLAQRYHAVKFFERQKVTRRIQQVKKQLARGEDSEGEKLGKKDRKRLQKKLEELRVDLNYIIHYPKLKKYISLFPPELRSEPHAHSDPYPHTYSRSKEASDDSHPENDTDAQREEVRAWVRERMAAGQMSAEPEVELHTREHRKPQGSPSHERQSGASFGPAKDSAPALPQNIGGDEFFEDDGGSEDGEGDGDGDEEMDDD